jgi:chromosome segregation ATPase
MSEFNLDEFEDVMRDSMPHIRFEEMVASACIEIKTLREENAMLKSRDRDVEIETLKRENASHLRTVEQMNAELMYLTKERDGLKEQFHKWHDEVNKSHRIIEELKEQCAAYKDSVYIAGLEKRVSELEQELESMPKDEEREKGNEDVMQMVSDSLLGTGTCFENLVRLGYRREGGAK